jgi:V/A-type H+-transporting ATPase subunit K
MILRNSIQAASLPSDMYIWQLLYGLLGGLAMGFSAWMQGRAGANAADAFAETGKGFVNYIIILGVIETVALFVMVFLITALP